MANEKHFPKTISQWEFDCGLFTNLPRIIVACDFSPSSFKLKRGTLPLFTKNHMSYQAKIFLWTKLLENLLLAKNLISVAAALMSYKKQLNDKFKKLNRQQQNHAYLYFPEGGRRNYRGTDVFSNIVELLFLLYYTFMHIFHDDSFILIFFRFFRWW